ncbi:MAG TPA: trypsin-like peptidase domain-containing protein [Thermoanaerobaculia bacterium]|nr:trypsin-like peptidase domain-containing protein [Thermoanaerobaculia bacterium]
MRATFLIRASLLVATLLIPSLALAQEAPLRVGPPAVETVAIPPPLRLAERADAAPLASLAPALEQESARLAALALRNRQRQLPLQNGIARDLPRLERLRIQPGAVQLSQRAAGGLLERTAEGRLVWGTEVRVADAWRLRLHLSAVALPPGSRLWVWGEQETVGPFGLELKGPDGDLWTPSVGGNVIRLEVEMPASGGEAGFLVDRVLQLFELDATGAAVTGQSVAGAPCLEDVQCINSSVFDVVDLAQAAIAHIQFIDGGSGFICSGGLLNDQASSGIPWFLTANHCFDNQSAASTLEAFFDFFSATCDGAAPSLGSLPRASGSTLMATGSLGLGMSDYTFLRLSSVPGNRVFLGWNANTAVTTNGTTLHRISHPMGLKQHYSQNHVDTGAITCSGAPRPTFIYATYDTGLGNRGGTFGGSSGSPLIRAGGQVVGQLTGGCGPNPSDGCDYDNADVDGAFASTFPAVEPFLAGTGTGCVANATTMCLVSDRFQIEINFNSGPPQNLAGDGMVVPLGSDNSGMFYFFAADNWEMLVKVLNACPLNNRYWVFFAATTNVGFTLTVTDTDNGTAKTYTNPIGMAALPVQDTNAFATCP